MQGIFYFFLKKLGKAKVFNMETKNSCFPLFFILAMSQQTVDK